MNPNPETMKSRADWRHPIRLSGVRYGGAPRGRLVALGAAFLAGAILFAPTASGSPLISVVKHSPPFHGTLHIGQVIISKGCGAAASFAVVPKFNLSTGIGLVSSKSSVTGCGPPGFPDYGATEGITGFDSVPFTWHASMGPNITYNFSVKLVANLTATPMSPAGGPFAWASYTVFARADAWDLTTASIADSFTLIISDTTNFSKSGVVNDSWNLPNEVGFLPGNFTAGHQYFIQFYVEAFEFTHAPSHSSLSAAARLNMATGGHHFKAVFWELF